MWQSIGLTLLLLLGHTLIRRLIHKSLLALGQSRQVSENRVLYVAHVFHFLLGCATLLVLATFWLNYASARGDQDEAKAIRQGIVQVMMLIAPFLRDAERVHLHTLSKAYLD